MSTPAIAVTTPAADAAAEAATEQAIADGPDAAKVALDFKSKINAPIPPEMKATLDATIARIQGIEAAAVEAAAAPAASPTATPKAPAAPAKPAAPVAPAAPPVVTEGVTPQQIIETSKAQAKTAHQQRQKAEQLEARAKELEPFARALPLLKTDPEAFCEAVGVPWVDVVKTAVAKKTGRPVAPPSPNDSVKVLEARTAALEKQATDRAAAIVKEKYDTDVAAWKGNIAQDIVAGGEALELCAKFGQSAIEAIFELQDLHFNENGVILPIRDAALQVEAALESKYAPIASSKKFQPKQVAPAAPAAAPKAPTAPVPGQKASPTLTSQHVPTTAAAQPAEPPENETDAERLERIARKYQLFPGTQR